MKRSLKINPDNQPATREQIRDKRNAIEIMPVLLSDGKSYDYNHDTAMRFTGAIAQFSKLPGVKNSKITWKLADNTFKQMTKTQLQAAWNEIQEKAAIRSSLAHIKAEEMAAAGVTVGYINDLANWGL